MGASRRPFASEEHGIPGLPSCYLDDRGRRVQLVSRALHDQREAVSTPSQLETDDPGNVDGRLRLAGAWNEVGSIFGEIT